LLRQLGYIPKRGDITDHNDDLTFRAVIRATEQNTSLVCERINVSSDDLPSLIQVSTFTTTSTMTTVTGFSPVWGTSSEYHILYE
jgi:hypothetical protein